MYSVVTIFICFVRRCVKMKFCIGKIITKGEFKYRDVEKLRGYFGTRFVDNDIFHNHKSKYEFQYRFPKIQYRLKDSSLSLFAVGDSIPIMKECLKNLDSIKIMDNEIKIENVEYTNLGEDFFVDEKLHKYKFETVWLALNQENYIKYLEGEFDIDRQIQNNLLSNFKGLGIKIDKQIMAKGDLYPVKVNIKNIRMFGFKGEFVSNVIIPEYMALGKRQSIGFGMVKSIVDNR